MDHLRKDEKIAVFIAVTVALIFFGVVGFLQFLAVQAAQGVPQVPVDQFDQAFETSASEADSDAQAFNDLEAALEEAEREIGGAAVQPLQ